MNKNSQIELEAAAFRRLISYLQGRTDVQNIDLMITAGFCRNCLSKWYLSAAEEQGVALDYEQALLKIYGMPYSEWKEKFQQKATPEQLAAYEKVQQLRKE